MDKKKMIGSILSGAAILTGIALKFLPKKNPEKYSLKWFESLSLDELNKEREKVQWGIFNNPKEDLSKREWAQDILDVFDDYISKKKWGNEKPNYGNMPHREHGWYLFNDD